MPQLVGDGGFNISPQISKSEFVPVKPIGENTRSIEVIPVAASILILE